MSRLALLVRRRVLHTLAAGILTEVAVGAGVLAGAELVEPVTGDWVFIPAGVVVVATLPLLALNLVRVVRAEARTDP